MPTTMTTIFSNTIASTKTPDYPAISYTKLVERNADEAVALHEACERDRLWYLDLHG